MISDHVSGNKSHLAKKRRKLFDVVLDEGTGIRQKHSSVPPVTEHLLSLMEDTGSG
jgi:hypothetical protein